MSNDTFVPTSTSLAQQYSPALIEQAMQLIIPARRIAILAHEHPDGDALGSSLGLAHILRAQGKVCVPACADPAPRDFRFLPGVEMLQTTLGDEQFDLVIALDAGELSRYGALYEQHKSFLDQATILNIDHHVSSSGCGKVNIIDPTAAATAEMLVLFQQQADLPLPQEAATCLLTGFLTDTGSFQYQSTTGRTLEAAAQLLRAGANPESIARPLFRTQPLARARFEAVVINNIQTACNGRLIWSFATQETLAQAGATAEMDDNFSGMLRDIEGVQIAAFFKSYGEPGRTRLSMRSSEPYSAAEICMRFGGGGHARAAGATIEQPIENAIPYVVAILQQVLQG